MKCYIHPERDAVGACIGCGKFICEECRVETEGKNFCKKCVVEKVELVKDERAPTYQALQRAGKIVVPPEYKKKPDPEGFCWPAFFFSAFWYLAKGMWKKAMLIFVIHTVLFSVTYGLGNLFFDIYLAIVGRRDYFRYYSCGKQFWW
jgi:hypothetical protein